MTGSQLRLAQITPRIRREDEILSERRPRNEGWMSKTPQRYTLPAARWLSWKKALPLSIASC